MARLVYRSKDGDRLDWICQAHYGYVHGAVEAVLAHNRTLAAQGVVLPAGVLIELPELAQPVADKAADVSVWD